MPDPTPAPAAPPAAPAPVQNAPATPPPAAPPAAPPPAPPAAAQPPAAPPARPPTPSALEGAPPAPPNPPAPPAAPAPGDAPKPVEYKLELPQGSLLGPKAVEDTIAFAKANNLSNDVAKAILERDSTALGTQREVIVKQLEDQSGAWYGQLQKDPSFGVNSALISKGLKQYDPKGEFLTAVKAMHQQNNPILFNFLSRVFGGLREDRLVTGGRESDFQDNTQKTDAEIIYGEKKS